MTFCSTSMDQSEFECGAAVRISGASKHLLGKRFLCSAPSEVKQDITTDSIGILWTVPEETHHIKLSVVDVSCQYGCNRNCTFVHWKACIPLKQDVRRYRQHFHMRNGQRVGIKINGAKHMRRYTRPNSFGLRAYTPLCPIPGTAHAYVVRCVMYNQHKRMLCKSQSAPYILEA